MSIIDNDFAGADFKVAFGTNALCLASDSLTNDYTTAQLFQITKLQAFELPSTYLFNPSSAFQTTLLELVYSSTKLVFTNLTAYLSYDYKIATPGGVTLQFNQAILNSDQVIISPRTIKCLIAFLFHKHEMILSGTATSSDEVISANFTLDYTLENYNDQELTAIVDFTSSPKLLSSTFPEFIGSDTTLGDVINVTIVTSFK